MTWVTTTGCPICGHSGWCQEDGDAIQCMRSVSDHLQHGPPFKIDRDKNGNTYAIYYRDGKRPRKETCIVTPCFEPTKDLAPPDDLNEVYRALIDMLTLSPEHADRLHHRGIKECDTEMFIRLGYRSLPPIGRPRIAAQLVVAGFERKMCGTPGMILKKGNNGSYWTVGGWAGLLIPVRDAEGRIVRMMTRPDTTSRSGKYQSLTSARHGGPKATSRVHVPAFPTASRRRVWVTEGVIKADVATYFLGEVVLGLPGCSMFRNAIAIAKEFQAEQLIIAMDADWRHNHVVREGLISGLKLAHEAGFEVALAIWDPSDGKGIDDVLAAGHSPELVVGTQASLQRINSELDVSACQALEVTEQHPNVLDGEPIVVCADFAAVCAQTRIALTKFANPPRVGGIYWFGGQIAQLKLDPGSGRLRPYVYKNPQSFRELLSLSAKFAIENDEGSKLIQPPEAIASAILYGGPWPTPVGEVPVLDGITTVPMLLPDGTVLQDEQYVASHRLYLKPDIEVGQVPTTIQDATAAAGRLMDLVKDFPFASDADRSVWLSLLLTLVGRSLIDGPTPAFGINANRPGTGKSLLVAIASIIAYGEAVPVSAAPQDEDEWRKSLLAVAVESIPLATFDNSRGTFGSQALEGAITAGRIRGRLLGTQTNIDMPWRAVVAVTGNNLAVTTDMGRRMLTANLDTPLESPEQRDGFAQPRILEFVRKNRASLLRDVLTMLSAGLHDREDRQLPPMGSFEAWSDVVRHSIAIIGLVDPLSTQVANKARSDYRTEAIQTLFANWENFWQVGKPVSVSQILARIEQDYRNGQAYAYSVWDAIATLCGNKSVSAATLGYRFRDIRDMPVNGRRLVRASHNGNWICEEVHVDIRV